MFNELALNQFETGDFGHRVLTATGISGDGAADALGGAVPCTGYGIFRTRKPARFVVTKEGALGYELPIDLAGNIDGGRVASANLAAVATSSLGVKTEPSKLPSPPRAPRQQRCAFANRLGRRMWSSASTGVRRNGLQSMANIFASKRKWQHGDVVTIHYSMELLTKTG